MTPYQAQWSSWAYSELDPFSPFPPISNYPDYLADSMETYQTHNRHMTHHHNMSRATESKPRLSKDEVEVLEAEFQKNHKPSSSTKKALAESMRVDNARINNWFQNRRAREKKENNIREYEAKQRLEKKAEAESGHQPEKNRKRDLVASSAPFPEPRTSLACRVDPSQSPSPNSMVDASSDTTEPSQTGDMSSSPLSTPQNRPATPEKSKPPATVKSERDDMLTKEFCHQLDGYFRYADFSIGEVPMDDSHILLSADAKPTGQQLFRDLKGLIDPDTDGQDSDGVEKSFAVSSLSCTSPVTTDGSLPASPQAMDVASRRNRRPAPLAISGSRAHSCYTPKIMTDLDKRVDRSSPLRRVSSSTGCSRVKKVAATPRSPFDINTDTPSSHLKRSPTGARAPPTPDTPFGTQQHGPMDDALSYSLDGKYMVTDLALQDPTLGTPPTTPGFVEALFNMGSGYDMSISEEALIDPSLGRLAGGLSMADVSGGLSGYIASQNCSGQEAFLISSQMSHGYMGSFFEGGNVGFDWIDLSKPTTSPGFHPRQAGFMNMKSTNLDHDRS